MTKSYLGEVDEVINLFDDEIAQIQRELDKLKEIKAGRKSSGRFPLGKKFLINRGRFVDRLNKLLENSLGRVDD